MRISFDALRLCALVAAGATSGYLWRAAFESSTPEVRVVAPPGAVQRTPAPTVVRIPPHHLVRSGPRPAVAHPLVARSVTRRISPSTPAALASRPVRPSPRTPAAPAPSTTPPPPTSSPPSAPPTPAPQPPASAPTSSPSTSAPTAAAVAAPAPPAATPPPPPPTTSSTPPPAEGARPGWGKGDDNHDHTGPGGGDKKNP